MQFLKFVLVFIFIRESPADETVDGIISICKNEIKDILNSNLEKISSSDLGNDGEMMAKDIQIFEKCVNRELAGK